MPCACNTTMNQDTLSYAEVVEAFVSSGWHPADGEPSLHDLETTPEEDLPILQLVQPPLRAELKFEPLPGPDHVCQLFLIGGLDPTLEPNNSHFTGSLSDAHFEIGKKYEMEPLQAIADPQLILKGPFPTSLSDARIESLSIAITTAAHEVECLHRDICEPLGHYVETPCRH